MHTHTHTHISIYIHIYIYIYIYIYIFIIYIYIKSPRVLFLVTANVVGLYPSIPHKEGILALKRKLEEQTSSKISSNYLVKLVEFVVKNNFCNLTTKLRNRSLVLLLGLSLLHCTPVFIWRKLGQIFLKRRSFNHLHG